MTLSLRELTACRLNILRESLNRRAEPDEIADDVTLPCSPQAEFINGQVMRVDGLLFNS